MYVVPPVVVLPFWRTKNHQRLMPYIIMQLRESVISESRYPNEEGVCECVGRFLELICLGNDGVMMWPLI